jgi:hypothetical protein
MAKVENNRWAVTDDQFAVSIRIEDVSAFFSRQLVIEPGTRAVIIDSGQSLGELSPGTYTIESFAERLKFWSRKQCTAILTREEDVVLELDTDYLGRVLTAEQLAINAELRLTIQLNDVSLFLKNLMGPRDGYSISELEQMIVPVAKQALWSAAGRMSITELTGPDVRDDLNANMEQGLGVSLSRYGLRFTSVQLAELYHEGYDENREETGRLWLQADSLKHNEQEIEIASQERLIELKQVERTNELDTLADNLGVDKEEADVGVRLRRAEVLAQMGKAANTEKFNQCENKAERLEIMLGFNRDQVVGLEELDVLLEGYEERKEDRVSARDHLLAKLEMELEMDLQAVAADLDHHQSIQTLDHEIALAGRVEVQENEDWRRECEKLRRESEQRFVTQQEELRRGHTLAREQSTELRDDEFTGLLHQQRVERQSGEMQLAALERETRIQQYQLELTSQSDESRHVIERRQKEWELEIGDRESDSQLARLRGVQEMNAEIAEREQRNRVELETLREDASHRRTLDRMQMAGGMNAEALIATADTDNAAMLVDLKKTEATAQVAGTQNGQQQEMLERLSDVEREKADAIASAYKEAMQSQQQNVQQMIGALGQMGQAASGATPQQPQVAAVPIPPPPQASVGAAWFVAVNGQRTGPFNDTQVQQQISAGQINATTQVVRLGEQTWRDAGGCPELASLLATYAPPPPPPPPPPPANA